MSCLSLCNPMDYSPPGSFVHGDYPGKNTGVGCHALLQGIFPNQGLNPGLLHCRQILYHLSHQGSSSEYQELKPNHKLKLRICEHKNQILIFHVLRTKSFFILNEPVQTYLMFPFLKWVKWSAYTSLLNFPGGSDGKESAYNAEDLGSIPGLGRFPEEGSGYPLQHSCLENPMDRGA